MCMIFHSLRSRVAMLSHCYLIFQKYTRRRLRRHLLLDVIEVYFTFSKLLYLSIRCLEGRRLLLSPLPALHKPFIAFPGCVPCHRHIMQRQCDSSPKSRHGFPRTLWIVLRDMPPPHDMPMAWHTAVLRIHDRHSRLCLKGF